MLVCSQLRFIELWGTTYFFVAVCLFSPNDVGKLMFVHLSFVVHDSVDYANCIWAVHTLGGIVA